MIGTVKIGDHDVAMSANAATAIRYQQAFGGNLLQHFMGNDSAEDSALVVQELAYIMARSAEGADMNKLSRDDYISWLEQFEPLDFVNGDTTTEIINIYLANTKTDSKVKKEPGRPTEK